jgi:hypothetical protein
MTDHLHPEPDDTELLASGFVDGILTAEDAARVEGSPDTAALAATFTTMRTLVGDVAPAAAEARDRALAAALAAYDERGATAPAERVAAVVHLADRRGWPTRVLAAAAAVVVLGVIGVSVLRSPDSDKSSGPLTTDGATSGLGAGDESAPATMGVFNVAASPAIAVHSPEELLALAQAKVAPAPSTPASTVVTGGVTAADAATVSPAMRCLTDSQVFVADILYNGRLAIAARDTVTGVTQAIDEQCTVLAEAVP